MRPTEPRPWPLRVHGGGLLRGPLHARALFAPTPNPPPRPLVSLVQASGSPLRTQSPLRGATRIMLSRRASVRGGR